MKQQKPVVAHLVLDYLNLTESWVHTQVATQKKFQPVVLCRNARNLDQFPVKKIFKYSLLSDAINQTSGPFVIVRKLLGGLQRGIDALTDKETDFYFHILNKSKAKLIHAHFGPTGFKALELKQRTKLPLVVSFYGSDVYWLPKKEPIWQQKYVQLFKQADAIIVRGPSMEKQLIKLGCPTKKIYYIEYGIDLDKISFKPRQPTDRTKLLTACTLVKIKGIDYVVRAFSKIAKKFPQATLTIIGSGPEEQNIEQLIKDLKLSKQIKRISFMPFKKLLKEVCRYHIFLHPSVTLEGDIVEGNPTSLIERIASGMPVIATRHGDISLMVRHNYNGLLVPERNIKALAKAMSKLITQKHLWKKFAQNGRKIAIKHFDAHQQTHKRETLYQQLISP